MVIKRVKCCREMSRVRAKGHCVSQIGIHWWCVEVLLPQAKIMTHLRVDSHIPYTSPQPLSNIQLSSLCPHPVLNCASLNPPSIPFQDQLTVRFLITNPSSNQYPILISVPSCAFPSLTVLSAPTFFSFAVSIPSLFSLVFLQLQGHSSSTPYQSLGLNWFPNSLFLDVLPIHQSNSHLPQICQYFMHQNPHLHPPFSWHWGGSQSLESLLASLCPTFLCLSLSFLVPSLTLDALFSLWTTYFRTFVPALFTDLLILEKSVSKEIPYLSEANTKVFIDAMV